MQECVEHLGLSISFLLDRVWEKGSDRLVFGLEWSEISTIDYRIEILSY
jgi:hypothetical protein